MSSEGEAVTATNPPGDIAKPDHQIGSLPTLIDVRGRLAGGACTAGLRLRAALGRRRIHSASAGRDVELCAVAGGGPTASLSLSGCTR